VAGRGVGGAAAGGAGGGERVMEKTTEIKTTITKTSHHTITRPIVTPANGMTNNNDELYVPSSSSATATTTTATASRPGSSRGSSRMTSPHGSVPASPTLVGSGNGGSFTLASPLSPPSPSSSHFTFGVSPPSAPQTSTNAPMPTMGRSYPTFTSSGSSGSGVSRESKLEANRPATDKRGSSNNGTEFKGCCSLPSHTTEHRTHFSLSLSLSRLHGWV
jgi:hypothetical protein